MAVVAVRTPILTPAEGIDFLRSSHIPFSGPSAAFTTSFQADFGPFSSPPCRTPAVPRPTLAQVEHRDVGNIKEFRTESGDSFQWRPQQQQVTARGQTPAWTKLTTNFKMHADPREVTQLSVQSHSYTPPHTQSTSLSREVTEITDPQSYPPPHHPSSPSLSRDLMVQGQSYTRPSKPHPARVSWWSRAEEKLPESTHRASFTPLCVSPVVKASAKHLERCCTVKGDSRGDVVVSHYGDTFRGQCQPPPQLVDKQSSSSVPMGDQAKTIERETTHAAAFTYTAVSGEDRRSSSSRRSATAVTPPWTLNLGDDYKEPWSSTSREAFGDTGRSGDAVHLSRRNRNLSCVPRGDTHQGRNRDMMLATTNRFFFSERNHRERPVHVSGADLRTKSNVELGGSGLRGQHLRTTVQDHYPWRGGHRATTCSWTPGWTLSGEDPGPVYSIVQADFTPPAQTCRQTLNPQHLDMMKESHIRAPCVQHYFTTTHTDSFQIKPLSCVAPLDRHKQLQTHFIL